MKHRKLIMFAAGYLLIGVGRGLYVASKYPTEVHDAAWWTRAALVWPVDLIVDLFTQGNIG